MRKANHFCDHSSFLKSALPCSPCCFPRAGDSASPRPRGAERPVGWGGSTVQPQKALRVPKMPAQVELLQLGHRGGVLGARKPEGMGLAAPYLSGAARGGEAGVCHLLRRPGRCGVAGSCSGGFSCREKRNASASIAPLFHGHAKAGSRAAGHPLGCGTWVVTRGFLWRNAGEILQLIYVGGVFGV